MLCLIILLSQIHQKLVLEEVTIHEFIFCHGDRCEYEYIVKGETEKEDIRNAVQHCIKEHS